MVTITLSLPAYYKFVSSMKYEANFSIEECDGLYPFERDFYVGIVSDLIVQAKTKEETYQSF